jgi:hypothetical protein
VKKIILIGTLLLASTGAFAQSRVKVQDKP